MCVFILLAVVYLWERGGGSDQRLLRHVLSNTHRDDRVREEENF